MGRSRDVINTPSSKIKPTAHFLWALNCLNELPMFTCWELPDEIPYPGLLKKTQSDHAQPLRLRKQQNQQLPCKWDLTSHQPGISLLPGQGLPKVCWPLGIEAQPDPIPAG